MVQSDTVNNRSDTLQVNKRNSSCSKLQINSCKMFNDFLKIYTV